MYKIIIFVLIFITFSSLSFASEKIKIISRTQRLANEKYRYLDSSFWQDILSKRKKRYRGKASSEAKTKYEKYIKKIKTANSFLTNNYPLQNSYSKIERKYNDNKLAWPVYKSQIKNSIVIHHTTGFYTDSFEAIWNIYKFHSIAKEWGDIGYNYLVGLNGEIFEGRAGGDYSIGAHDKWNNISSIGIAVIGDYNSKNISPEQYKSLKKLISFLKDKYSIDFSKKQAFFRWCDSGKYCDNNPIDVYYDYPLVGHRDSVNTKCPGDKLYEQVLELRSYFFTEEKIKNSKILQKLFKKLVKIDKNKLANLIVKIDEILKKDISKGNKKALEYLKHIALKIVRN